MEKILAVLDFDKVYAARFLEFFKKTGLDGFDMVLFTNLDSLKEFTAYQPVEVLVYCDGISPENLPGENIRYMLCLSGEKDAGFIENTPAVFRYQSAKKVLSDILTCYTMLENKEGHAGSVSIRFISIYPTVWDASKLFFAGALAKQLSEKKKVLFLPLDPLAASFFPAVKDTGHRLSEFIYYLKENNRDLITKMKSCLQFTDKLSYLSGLTHGFDLYSLSREDISRFMDEVAGQTDFDLVVLYLAVYSDAMVEILERSNEIYVTDCGTPYEEVMIKEWERQMGLVGFQIKTNKYHRLTVPMVTDFSMPETLFDLVKTPVWPVAEELADKITGRVQI